MSSVVTAHLTTDAVSTESDARQAWPAFIVGCHRSGTTLLRYLLDAHPALACPPESKFLAAFATILTYPQALRGLGSLGVAPQRLLADLRAMAEAYFHEFARRHGKRRWIDKTPNYVRLLPLLDALFGHEALFILMVRHPLDTADSLAKMAAFNVEEPEDPDIAASVAQHGRDRAAWVRHWIDQTETVLWFQEHTPGRTCLVRYEDLVTAPAAVLEKTLAFLAEARSPEILADLMGSAIQRPHEPGYEDPKIRDSGGIHRASIGKWRQWPEDEVQRLWALAENAGRRLGYDVMETVGRAHAVA